MGGLGDSGCQWWIWWSRGDCWGSFTYTEANPVPVLVVFHMQDNPMDNRCMILTTDTACLQLQSVR